MYCTIAQVLFAILFSSSVSAQGIEPKQSGYVLLESVPRGAEVYLGDSLLGRTPIRVDASRTASIVVYHPSRLSWNATSKRLGQHLPDERSGVVLLNFPSQTRLRSVPHGAAVFRADSLLGHTPLNVADDGSEYRLEAPGHASALWRGGDEAVLQEGEANIVRLVPLDTRASQVRFRGDGFRLPPVRIVLPAGIGLVAGVAAVMFKQRADAKYDAYRDSMDDMLLSDVKKYDIYAGISLAILQLGLGYFMYLLLNE